LINSIKFFFEKVVGQEQHVYDVPRAKKPFQLPAVFAEDEVKRLISATDNLKHRSMLCLAYAGGLRVSEIVHVQLKDIDSQRMVITLRAAKGKKDRQVMLSEKLLMLLRRYFKEYKPKQWLFEEQNGGQYSTRSIQEDSSRPNAGPG
jgi:integrase/recombinase XerD